MKLQERGCAKRSILFGRQARPLRSSTCARPTQLTSWLSPFDRAEPTKAPSRKQFYSFNLLAEANLQRLRHEFVLRLCSVSKRFIKREAVHLFYLVAPPKSFDAATSVQEASLDVTTVAKAAKNRHSQSHFAIVVSDLGEAWHGKHSSECGLLDSLFS